MKTKRILVDQAVPGMIVASDVYSFNNLLILNKETTLTDRIITRLKFYSINDFSVFIDIGKPTEINIKHAPIISHTKEIRESPEFKQFNQTFVKTLDSFRDTLDDTVGNKLSLDAETLFDSAMTILSESRNGAHAFNMLNCMRDFDDLSYAHSLNVGLICNVMGHWLKKSEEDIKVLTLCGMLHDIGKLLIPQNIIAKPSKLTENEFATIKTHTTQGYNLLKAHNLDQRIKYAALMHHEKCDGSGYPNKFQSKQIDEFAKIVAIADVYEAMTSPRLYREAICPFEVISIFESEGFNKYDPKYLIPFLNGIVQTYLHNTVLLSDGTKAEIVMINPHLLSKPIVRINENFIDLSKGSLSIVSIF